MRFSGSRWIYGFPVFNCVHTFAREFGRARACLEEKSIAAPRRPPAIEIANVCRTAAPDLAMGRRREAPPGSAAIYFWRDMQHAIARKKIEISGNLPTQPRRPRIASRLLME